MENVTTSSTTEQPIARTPEQEQVEQFYRFIATGKNADADLVQQLTLLRYHTDGSDHVTTTDLRQLLADQYPADCTVPLEHIDLLCRITAMADYSNEELTLLDENTRNQFMTFLGLVTGLSAARQHRLRRNHTTAH